MLCMYAIANCDTVKKARAFLDKKKVEYEFVDFKKTPPTVEQIKRWGEFFGELPVNKKGITFRKFKDEYESLTSAQKIKLIIENSSMIKRPVLEKNNKTIAMGFDEESYKGLKF
ncbi:MAG: Spx/MgsR family RNA polymerase-binding regulatory protein [Bacteriovorax sp.]|nr:Spx/MgsR family RNA polymerase-binding regulatory protein [Bacteriovorax sp.]